MLGLRKKVLRNIALVLMVILLGIGVTQIYQVLEGHLQAPGENLSQYGVHEYKIDARFLEGKNLLEVQQKVLYENKYGEAFDTIYFHLYPNAFQDENKVPFPEDEMAEAYPKGFEAGYIKMGKVKVEGEDVGHTIEGEDDTLLALPLKEPLKPGERVSISFQYQVKVPPCASRFGYGENTYNFGNWYPIATVYDESGWNLEPYYAIGDPFYSEVGNYEVTLRLPEKYELATTGNILKTNTEKDNQGQKEKIWKIKAQGVRDFAWVISDKFKVKSGKVDDTKIKVYYLDGQAGTKALEVTKNSIEAFNQLFGKYPYKQFSVVSNDFYIGGMEYPNLIYIDQNIFSGKYNIALEYIIAHETAHQWWYGMVGNNEIDEPWIDEALTEYSTMLYYRERYGDKTMMTMFNEMIVNDYVRSKALAQDGKERIAKSVNEFQSNHEYSGMVYSKGAMMFYELEEKVGRENFQKILQYYFKGNQFTNVTGKDIQDITQAVTGKDYQEFFDQWLSGKIRLEGEQAA